MDVITFGESMVLFGPDSSGPLRYVQNFNKYIVGAGDGFAAGFLSGMLNKLDLRGCSEHANGVGAMAVLVKGDMEGYPNNEQVMAFIGKAKIIER
ncbi:PfkB family carbohydrate kinase [Clostridium estertheticum]|uniref:PfkB family carbohydrate kinase n=1 Tax=Clostridium estertheticum TaxID=238834 RepID=UPI001C6F1BCC|nr:carbohydrate kinase family protein [Clostridium estertheticum]MBW9153654.1 hypothetical protein [Clostridium estertheticum]WLC82989.1 hypothetical protein KTC97_12790 [Clostridium estertheticum]